MLYGWTSLLFLLMKHNTLSKYPQWTTCLFFYEVINLFIKPKKFLLMVFICKFKDLYLIYFSSMACWCSFFIFSVSCRRTCENNTLQQCLLKSLAFGCWLENNSSYIPSSLIYRSSFFEYLGQLAAVPTVAMAATWCLCWIFSLVQWCLATQLAAFSYLNALQTFLARVPGFLLMITTNNSTGLKTNGMTEDIFISSCWSRRIFVSGLLSVNIGLDLCILFKIIPAVYQRL